MKKTKGFTLLELIIVIIVIGILVAMAMPQFLRVAERGRCAKAQSILDMFRKAEGIYYAINSTYTDENNELALDVPEILNTDTDPDWRYSIASANAAGFVAEAIRSRGKWESDTITINQSGEVGGTHNLINPISTP